MKKTNKIIFIILAMLIVVSISQISYAANLTSNEYKITAKENTNYIIGIYPNTRAEKVKSNLKTETNINIYDKNGQMLKDDAIVATGNKIQIGQETYIAIVCGDANADGNTSLTDLVKIKSHLIGKEILTGAAGIATDVDASGKTTSTDILNLKRLLVRIIEEREIFEGKYSNNEYNYKKNKLTDKITITELKDSTASGTLQIPSKIDGNEVKEINGFLGENSKITKVTIPTGIEEISNTAFSGLTRLQEIEVSGLNEKYSSEDGILYNKAKDTLVFYPRGKANTEYTIKAEVRKIGQYAFYKNSTIQKLYIPDTVQDFEKNAFEEMQGKVYVKEGAKLIAKLKEKGISYAIDAKPEVTKLTSVEGTNQVITLNIEGTDDVGIVAWGVALKGSQNIQWKEISQSKRFSTTYKEINQNGTYVVSLKDTVGNIGTKEIIINGVDKTAPEVKSIKIISPTSGEYKPGQKVIIRVQFSEKVKGTAPTLKLKIGSTSVTTTATNPTGTLDYIDYTCTANEKSIGKIEVESYTGGNITDVSGNKVTIVKLANSGNSIIIIQNTKLEIHYLNLGRVDGILFICDGEYAFMDSGFESDGKDTVTYLKKLGIKNLKYLIASHPHHNHIDGFIPIVDYANVERAYFSRYADSLSDESTNHYKKITNYLKKKKIPISTMDVGDTIKLGSATIKCFGAKNTSNINDSSLVFTITLGKQSFMFTGDIDIGNEVSLAQKWGSALKSTVLKAPHHDQAIDSKFINAVNPEYIIVCNHTANLRGSSYGKKVLYTCNGTIVVSTDGNTVTVKQ